MAIEPGQTIGPYLIQEKLGEGGMGSVFKAQQSGVNRAVVVKVLLASVKDNPQMLERFKRELDIIAQLEHPHILPVYDFGEHEGNPYIVMRFMGGGSLLDALRQHNLDRNQTLRVFEQIASALDYAHQRHIIHRDLKPANVLLDDQGNAYLADFGLARTLEGGAELTKTGSILGTPAYMSPEQGRGEKLDQRSDIYSLAVMAFEALAGQPLFTADSAWKLISKHLTETPPAITNLRPDLPYSVEAVFNSALAKDRSQRQAEAGQFIKAVRTALLDGATLPSAATPAGPATQAQIAPRTGLPLAPSVPAGPRSLSTLTLPQSAAVAIPVVGVLVIGLVAVLGVIVLGVFLFRDRLFPSPIFTYAIGTAPRAMVFDGQDLWIASSVGQFVARVHATACDQQPDPCGQAVSTYPAENLVTGIAYDDADIWTANGTTLSLTQLDRSSGAVTVTVDLPNVPSNLLFAGGHLWVSSSGAGQVTKIDPAGAIVADYAVPGGPLSLTYDGHSLWIAAETSRQLVQLDPQTGSILNTIAIDGATEVNALAFDGESIWVALQDRNAVIQINQSGDIVGQVPVGSGPVAVVFGGQSIWVANRGSGTVSRIDPTTLEVLATLPVTPKPYALTYVACGANCGDLWIIDLENDVLQRLRVP